jgi:hypothetical protein
MTRLTSLLSVALVFSSVALVAQAAGAPTIVLSNQEKCVDHARTLDGSLDSLVALALKKV